MKYDIIRACRIKGINCAIGQVIDLDDATAKEMMSIGRVAPHHEEVIEDRSIGLDESTIPRKRGRQKKVVFDEPEIGEIDSE